MNDDDLRKHIRFYTDPLEIALIDPDPEHFKNYRTASPEMVTRYIGLIENESHTGASLVFVIKEGHSDFIKVGTKWILKLGQLMPLRAEVKWQQKIDDVIFKVGVTILD